MLKTMREHGNNYGIDFEKSFFSVIAWVASANVPGLRWIQFSQGSGKIAGDADYQKVARGDHNEHRVSFDPPFPDNKYAVFGIGNAL